MGIARRGKKGLFQHFRRVPTRYAPVESRALVRTALHTTDENLARNKATQIENLQDLQWEALLAGRAADATAEYEKLRGLAEARGVTYLPALEVGKLPVEAILERVEKAEAEPAPADALLGRASPPPVKVSQLFELYAELVADQLQGKSVDQIKRWAAPRKKSTRNLTEVVGDLDIRSITRDQALRFRRWWWERIQTGQLTANSGNKDLTYLSTMLKTVSTLKGWDFANPFSGLRFKEQEERRTPFSTSWISKHLLAPDVLTGLNPEARAILLAMINTGARPSEIIGLEPEHIRLADNIPTIKITALGRALKTKYSERTIPLVGISLEAMRLHPQGFPRYRDKSTTWSNTVTKFLRENHLLETERHSAYSLRHSLSDRLLNAGCEDRIRKEIMGHRPETVIYGAGSTLETRLDWLERVAL
jgi:integrase